MTSEHLRDRLERSLGASYRILEEIPGGGMARVFTAEDRALGRKIVIKVLSPELAASVNLERFKREIQLAAALQHANVVPLLSAGDVDGLPYYTMPYVAGRSVRGNVAGGRGLPINDVVTILRDTARALAYAHEHGVVHRDIKPDNILWGGGAATVTDFGIAKAISVARSRGERDAAAEALTVAGTSLGTPAYMAPEQISADPAADHRVDIYAFGITAYELIAGRTPFAGRTQQQILAAHLTERPEHLSRHAPTAPRGLVDLAMRCLEKDPDKRPQSAAEIVEDLSGVTTGERRARSRGSRHAAGIALAAAVGLVVTGVAIYRGIRPTPAPARTDLVAVLPFRIATADPGLRYLREGMIDLLASKFTGEGGLRAVEPRVVLDSWRRAGGSDARDLSLSQSMDVATWVGAGRLLLGDVVGTPTGLVLSATVVGVPRGDSIARVTAEGPADSLAVLVDRVAGDLLFALSGEIPARLPTLAGTNLPALRAYLDGQVRLRRAEVIPAAESFERALALDSSFALAGLGLSLASSWFGDPDRGNRGLAVAWRERHRLGPRDQALVEAIAGPRYPQPSGTVEIYQARQRYFAQAQDRADAWYLLGDHIFHFGRVFGIADPVREAQRYFLRAAELDSTYVVGYIHAIDASVVLGDTAQARRLIAMRRAMDTTSTNHWFYSWLFAHAADDTALVERLWGSLPEPPLLFQAVDDVARTALNSGFGARDGLRAVQRRAEQTGMNPQFGGLSAYHWALTVGDADVARESLLRAFPDTASFGTLNRRISEVRAANVGLGDEATATAAAARLAPLDAGPLSADSALRRQQRSVTRVLEVWRLLRGDSSGTARSLARLRAFDPDGHADSQSLELEIVAIEALRESLRNPRGPAPQLERLDSLMRAIDWNATHYGRIAELAIINGRLFSQRGEHARAAAAVRRRVGWDFITLPYLVAQLRDEGRYAAAAGDRDAAIAAYRHYLLLRHSPSAEYAAEVRQVRDELARLQRG